MLIQDLVLDELRRVMLLNRNEHPNDIAEQVAPALRNAVEENWLGERALVEFRVFFVQRIGPELNPHNGRRNGRVNH
jgi:hypothetical protein